MSDEGQYKPVFDMVEWKCCDCNWLMVIGRGAALKYCPECGKAQQPIDKNETREVCPSGKGDAGQEQKESEEPLGDKCGCHNVPWSECPLTPKGGYAEKCHACEGHPAIVFTVTGKACPRCYGTGQEDKRLEMARQKACSDCKGTGTGDAYARGRDALYCKTCQGTGLAKKPQQPSQEPKRKEVIVEVPAKPHTPQSFIDDGEKVEPRRVTLSVLAKGLGVELWKAMHIANWLRLHHADEQEQEPDGADEILADMQNKALALPADHLVISCPSCENSRQCATSRLAEGLRKGDKKINTHCCCVCCIRWRSWIDRYLAQGGAK